MKEVEARMSYVDEIELPSYLDHTDEVRQRLAEAAARAVVLEVDELSREFEGPGGRFLALDRVSCEVRRREFISVIGPSGCGKSTLIRILAGLDWPSSGSVRLDGAPVAGPGPDRGMVFQGYTLFPWLSVKKNVMFGLRMKGVSSRVAERHARQWLSLVGLEDFEDHYPSQLSGGMKQRVAIARALANEPRILLMDEPFGALDAQTRSSMQAHLLRIWETVDVTVLFITHDLDEAIYLSDRIVVLGANPGRVLEVIDVPLPRPRTPGMNVSRHFLATKRHLETLIHSSETSAKSASDSVRPRAA
jgi:NitT/TauT family transport system ATP-binding protein